MIEAFMKNLSKELGLSGSFETPTPGVYSVPIDETHHITVTEVPPGFSLHCTVCPCPTKGEEVFFESMLLGNLFGQATQGAVLGLDAEGKALTLSMDIDYQVDYKEFRNKLEDFFNAADFWREEVDAVQLQSNG